MIKATHSVVDTPTTPVGQSVNKDVKKKNTTTTTKRLKGKKSSSRKNYKKLKSKLKGLIEEGVILKETLRRKEEQLVEMSRDIHYILGRLLPYQKETLDRKQENTNSPSKLSSLSSEQQEQSPLTDQMFDPQDIKSESQPPNTWDGYVSSVSTLDPDKNRINFSLPPEVERQLASVYPPLTLPDDIFSES